MVRNSKFEKGRYDQNNYQKSVFYTGWLDEPAELDANRLNRMPTGQTGCKKSWKFDRIFMEE